MRSGDALVPMQDERLRRIHAETGPDFSAEMCLDARLTDLDPAAIISCANCGSKRRPGRTSNCDLPNACSRMPNSLLAAASPGAALLLLGTREALGRLLGQAEVISNTGRTTPRAWPPTGGSSGRALPVLDEIWRLVNLRNDLSSSSIGSSSGTCRPSMNVQCVRPCLTPSAIATTGTGARSSSGSIRGALRSSALEASLRGSTSRTSSGNRTRATAASPNSSASAGLWSAPGKVRSHLPGVHSAEQAASDFSQTSEVPVWLILHGEIRIRSSCGFLTRSGVSAGRIQHGRPARGSRPPNNQIPARLAAPFTPGPGVIARVGHECAPATRVASTAFSAGEESTRRRDLDRETKKRTCCNTSRTQPRRVQGLKRTPGPPRPQP